ncbi:MAG TPA: phosphoserine transaminase [Candidatus Dormibacteraeota bacterium]|nr:phosphoserine transaminase [Candidatus Dormibacteraeota bacterium]
MTTGSGSRYRIPQHLLPQDGRFGCGPSKVPAPAVDALASTGRDLLGTSHRQPPVKQLVQRVRDGISSLLSVPEGYEVILGNGGATSFWDAATLTMVERRSQHLVFGEFSSKFAAATRAAPFLEAPEVIESEPGTHPLPRASSDVDAYCLTQNETSTGVAMQLARTGNPDQLVLVDATSAAGGLPVEISALDAYYFSAQKCFAAEGGLWLAVLSPAALDRIERIESSDRWVPASLSLRTAAENSRQNQTYNTPAIATLFLLAHQIEWGLEMGGLDWAVARSRSSAKIIYDWAEAREWASPFVARPEQRSSVVATIDLTDEIPAKEVSDILRQNGIVDTDSYRKLGRNQLRVGLFPAIEPEDVAQLTRSIDWVVEALPG